MGDMGMKANQHDVFGTMADTWWDEDGPFRALHRLNIPRLTYMKHFMDGADTSSGQMQRVLDVGCGGGLLCEPLARQGYAVTGLDKSVEAIEVARRHAEAMGLPVAYTCQDLAEVAAHCRTHKDEAYDFVSLLEVLEHVDDPGSLIIQAMDCLKPGGLLFFSTLNRTWRAYVLGIRLAEDVLKLAPKGVHAYEKFLKPHEVANFCAAAGATMVDCRGITFSLTQGRWVLSSDLSINYIGVARKNL